MAEFCKAAMMPTAMNMINTGWRQMFHALILQAVDLPRKNGLGASVGIANHLLKKLGNKSVILVIIAFSVAPIASALFQRAYIPKKLIVAAMRESINRRI